MNLVKIAQFENGAHDNQNGGLSYIPDGWAVIPEGMVCENFPFGELTAEEIDGVMMVTSWTPGVIPEPEITEEEPTINDILNAMLGVAE